MSTPMARSRWNTRVSWGTPSPIFSSSSPWRKTSRGGALEGNFPVVDGHQPVHRPGHLLHGVGHQDDGGVVGLVVLPDVAQDGLHPLRVQPGGGLVQNEHLGLHGDHPGDGHPALLAAGQLEGGFFQVVVPQAHKVGRRPHPAVDLLLVQSHVLGAEGDVFIHRLLKELVLRVLEHQPHLKPGLFGDLGVGPDVRVLKEHRPRRRLEQGIQVLDQGGLSAAGVANNAQVLPGVGAEVHAVQRRVLKGRPGGVGVSELFRFDYGLHRDTSLLVVVHARRVAS